MCVRVRASVCLFVRPSVCPSARLSVYLLGKGGRDNAGSGAGTSGRGRGRYRYKHKLPVHGAGQSMTCMRACARNTKLEINITANIGFACCLLMFKTLLYGNAQIRFLGKFALRPWLQ